MAIRGQPIPFRMRETIKRLAESGNSRRAIARNLELSRTTVDKYAKPKNS